MGFDAKVTAFFEQIQAEGGSDIGGSEWQRRRLSGLEGFGVESSAEETGTWENVWAEDLENVNLSAKL